MNRCRQLAVFLLAFWPTLALSFYTSGSVVNLDPSSFSKKVPGDGVWLVEFYAPWCGHCQQLVPAWEETAAALKGILSVGAVDADAHKSLAGEFGIKGFPTIKLVTTGKNGKRKVVEFKGGRTSKEIVEWALSQAAKVALSRIGATPSAQGSQKSGPPPSSGGFYGRNSDVVTLTDGTFHSEVAGEELWMVEFYAPWCGHCKNLKPDWEQLATEVKGKVRIGAVDCTTEEATCQEFGIQGFPTIKYFGPDKDAPSDYQGGRDSSAMASFVLGEWRKLQPPPEAKELVDQHVLESECSGNEDRPPQKLCLIAFLPDILDSKAAGRRQYIQVLNNLAGKYSERPFSYLWAQGGAQPRLEAALGVGGYGYPALVALNPKEAKFAALRESFDLEHAVEFLERVRQGHERVAAIDGGLPELQSTSPWDGGEGAAVEADEFSLEDLMREEL